MSLTVVGSIAFDAVKTPFGQRDRMLGGSAVHHSLAASFFTDVRVVGPVGEDFGQPEYDVLQARGVNTDDIEIVPGGKTFFWQGHYEYDMNTAHTDDTQLNVFGSFEPKLSEQAKSSDVLFLANIQPDLQRKVRSQCPDARFVALDSMNLWIEIAKDSLLKAISEVDCLIINDAEIRQLTEQSNLQQAAKKIMELGPSVVVAKQGEYGSALFTRSGYFGLTAYPLESVFDPTGAGDSFAGGFLGFIAAHPGQEINDQLLRQAMAYGTTIASFNVEDFGTERVSRLTGAEINQRVSELQQLTHFEANPIQLRD